MTDLSAQDSTMPISITPTDLLPLWDQPAHISVQVDRDLFKCLDTSMDPLEKGGSFSRASRERRAAMDKVARDVSLVLFGAEVPAFQIGFGWPKHILGPEGPHCWNCQYIGICFDYRVTVEHSNPRVPELMANEERDGTIVFLTAEVDVERSTHINKCVNEALQEQAM